MTFDPYDELGIERDADDAAIKNAARETYKRTHPDTSEGNAETFGRARRAEMILRDPIKRRKFDATGEVDEDSPDTARAGALQIIQGFLEAAITAYVQAFDPRLDPRKTPIFDAFRQFIDNEIAGGATQITKLQKQKEFLADMGSRFESDVEKDSALRRSFELRVVRVQDQITHIEKGIELRRLALEIAGKHRFRQDEPDPVEVILDAGPMTPRAFAWRLE